MTSRLGDMTAAYIQPMIADGVEVMRRHRRPTFGHVLAFGAGGPLVEFLTDLAFRIHPSAASDVGRHYPAHPRR